MDNLETTTNVTEPIKAKRGRKSNKELIATLNMESFVTEKDTKKSIQKQNIINLNVQRYIFINYKKIWVLISNIKQKNKINTKLKILLNILYK